MIESLTKELTKFLLMPAILLREDLPAIWLYTVLQR